MVKYLTLLLSLLNVYYVCCAQAATPPSSQGMVSTQPDISKIQLGSVHATVWDLDNQHILYSKNAQTAVPIASITKLMTAMVVLDSAQSLNEYVLVSRTAQKNKKNAYSRIRLNSKLKRRDLLRLALMSSENLAASVLAHSYPGGSDNFVKAMNDKAISLGMHKTRFVDSSGLSPQNQSSASDLAKMVFAAAKYREIREYSTTPNYTANFKSPRYRLGYSNTNPLVHRNSWNISITKTGYIHEAGRCLVMITEIQGRQVSLVLLNSFGKRTPLGDAGRIRRWLTTGSSGPIVGAALRYEQEKSKQL